jgi:hypothetical protein
MADRKSFLVTLCATALTLGHDPEAEAQTASPSAAPAAKPAPAEAIAIAATMRRFDAGLSDAELDKIAHGIDDNLKAARALNPKGRPLRNSDEPVLTFDPAAP